MTRFKPAPNQQPLPFDEAARWSLIKQVDLPWNLKSMLLWMHVFIGKQPSWIMSMAEVEEVCGAKKTSKYAYINALRDLGLVHWEALRDGRRRFYICWSNLAEIVEEQSGSSHRRHSPGKRLVRLTECHSAIRNESSPNELGIPHSELSVRQTENIYRKTIPTIQDYPSSSSSAANAELLLMLVTAGIGQPGECLRRAYEHGMTDDDIRAVLEHFNAPENAQRWPAEVLFNRLTRAGAKSLSPSQGWYGESPDWKARQKQQIAAAASPEIRWGPVLDALPADQLLGLVHQLPPRDQSWARNFVEHAITSGEPIKNLQAREMLILRLMQ